MRPLVAFVLVTAMACGDSSPTIDAGGSDSGADSGRDSGDSDSSIDGGSEDAAVDSSIDVPIDAPPVDAPPVDAPLSEDMWSVEFTRNATNIDGEDEIRFTCDDATSGAGGHRRCDVGAGSYTYEVWLKGDAVDNPNTSSGVGTDVDTASYNWINGNIFLDRDVYGGSCDGRDFGASVIDGRVSFGVGATPDGSGPLTIYGSSTVVETPAVWHHIALVYDDDATPNRLRIYVDGALDYESTSALFDADRSIPDTGCTTGSASSAARQVDLAIATEKHGFGTISFDGRIGSVRIWDVARTSAQIGATWNRTVTCETPGLVGRFDLEEGAGSIGADACGVSPNATVDLGTRDLSRWVADGPPLL